MSNRLKISSGFQGHPFIKLESSKYEYMIVLAGYLENEVHDFISTFAIITFVLEIRIHFILFIYCRTIYFILLWFVY